MDQHETGGNVVPSVPIPSADLINYRFDQQDKAMAELKKDTKDEFKNLNDKFDLFTSTFVTQKDFDEYKKTADENFKEYKSSVRWAIGIITTIALGIGSIISVVFSAFVGIFFKH